MHKYYTQSVFGSIWRISGLRFI